MEKVFDGCDSLIFFLSFFFFFCAWLMACVCVCIKEVTRLADYTRRARCSTLLFGPVISPWEEINKKQKMKWNEIHDEMKARKWICVLYFFFFVSIYLFLFFLGLWEENCALWRKRAARDILLIHTHTRRRARERERESKRDASHHPPGNWSSDI